MSGAAHKDSSASPSTVGILAGMGPAAGVDFARLFVRASERWLRSHGHPVQDQAFPEHWIAQVPVSDRTQALQDPAAPQPLEGLAGALQRLGMLGARAVAMSCNTAHAWHGALQSRVPGVELLHIARETAAELQRRGIRRAALLATQGTYRMGLYEQAFAAHGIECVLPSEQAREWLMEGIYEGVKAGNMPLARSRFADACQQVLGLHGDVALVMACTEIPLALPDAPQAGGWTLIDPSDILATALARRAYG
ncbi:amino acid racemase [Acidovorax sp. GBBC 3334]|uniref:aspartate/glutamate racemase family protein n=1 Tax=Acidovorax sp. GBBC 3334 TaxID=2940496 RepID=UPI002303F948|nr:amino acid racemase [Acidovorax sp. GBBC 3334]MDA8456416.1 amino acid racemase [Acidovorax sp. GBBC 3334]